MNELLPLSFIFSASVISKFFSLQDIFEICKKICKEYFLNSWDEEAKNTSRILN